MRRFASQKRRCGDRPLHLRKFQRKDGFISKAASGRCVSIEGERGGLHLLAVGDSLAHHGLGRICRLETKFDESQCFLGNRPFCRFTWLVQSRDTRGPAILQSVTRRNLRPRCVLNRRRVPNVRIHPPPARTWAILPGSRIRERRLISTPRSAGIHQRPMIPSPLSCPAD